MDRELRARVLVAEARELGLTIDDLTSAASRQSLVSGAPVPTVSEYLAELAPTFTRGTRRTYGTYWRLAEAHFGDRRLDDVGVVDCEAVLAAVGLRAQRDRPGGEGEHLGISLSTLWRLVDEGRVPAYRPARNIIFRVEDLDTYLEQVRVQPGEMAHLRSDKGRQRH